MEKATRALLEADLTLAEGVIKQDAEIDALRLDSEERDAWRSSPPAKASS